LAGARRLKILDTVDRLTHRRPSDRLPQKDLYKTLAEVPGEQAFRPLSESECPLIKK
jgi:hypothetical protein